VGEPFLGKSEYSHHGERVVQGQCLMQGASDIFLGWTVHRAGWITRDFYLRQLWDGKGSAVVDQMEPGGMGVYAELCGWTLARAHAGPATPSPWLRTWAKVIASTGHEPVRQFVRRPERAGLRSFDPGHRDGRIEAHGSLSRATPSTSGGRGYDRSEAIGLPLS